MTLEELITLTKQALGNRSVTSDSTTWYTARVNAAYRRISTFQGYVKMPGVRQPQMRRLRFFELVDQDANTITSVLTDNFVTPTRAQASLYNITDVYDTTNNRWLERPSLRQMRRRDPDGTGVPRRWAPDGKGGVVGYRVYPRPGSSADDIAVREYVYIRPAALTAGTSPVIPEDWHPAIWMAAAAEGAALLEWSEKSAEMEGKLMEFIAERPSPIEESAASGGRRYFRVGSR